ncbi:MULTISPECIES: rhomboid family intramembrane serine protease [unclassified Moraxella]|uniref:rhomboid family intramembrane serine protease n=1 Tax=unclassified Moraxella TaxID=2685852 RepID=UPI003AF49A00
MSLIYNHNLFIVIITVVVSLLAWQSPQLMQRLIFYPPAVQRGQVDRFVTHGFIHADGMHLFFNMFTLFSFGNVVQRFFMDSAGTIAYVLFYLTAIVVAIIPTYMKHKNNPRYSSLGASGAVSAVVFSYVLMNPWSTLLVFFIPVPAIVFAGLYVGYSVWADGQGRGNINHSAHLVGGVFGMLATIAVEPAIVQHFFNALMHPRFLGMGG